MVQSTVVPIQVQPPPDVPSIPGQNANLTSYLRRFSTWATAQFATKIPTNQAVSSVMFVAPDGTVWRLRVDVGGVARVEQVSLGQQS